MASQHHHHIHVHQSSRGINALAELDEGPGRSLKRKVRGHQHLSEASFLPSNDRNEMYYPAARTRVDDPSSDSIVLTRGGGNWGNKLDDGARWQRRGKMVAWGPARAEWDLEERARKRLRQAAPLQSKSRSSSPPTLRHLRDSPPPPTGPYIPSSFHHRDLTSFVLDPAVQHTFTSVNYKELENTATELIAGESSLRKAFGGLWRALQGDLALRDAVRNRSPSSGEDLEELGEEVEEHKRAEALAVQNLFITPSSVSLPGPEPKMSLAPQGQEESLQWALGVLRELSEDGKEYMNRLEDIREGLGSANAVRSAVWREARVEALDEMRGESPEEV